MAKHLDTEDGEKTIKSQSCIIGNNPLSGDAPLLLLLHYFTLFTTYLHFTLFTTYQAILGKG